MTKDDVVFWLKQIKDKYIKGGDEEFDHCRKEAIDMAIEEMEKEERKKGKWIFVHPLQFNDSGAYMCSCCHHGSYDINPKTWKACPHCTALMEVDDETPIPGTYYSGLR